MYGTCGRPALAGDVSSALDFNVSHSRDVALYAVAGGYRVGIDIECLEAATDVDAIAERYLSAAHAARVRRRSGSAKSVTFLKCWTLAEAILKCTGDGLGGLSWPEGDRVLDSETMPPGAWSVRRLVPWPGYVATLVLQGRLRRLFRWDYSNGNQAGS